MNARLARILYHAAQNLRGERVGRVLRELEESQWWPAERLLEMQRTRLCDLLRYAYERVPYYRRTWSEAGFRAGDWEAADALACLPVVEKKDLQEYGAEMRAAPPVAGAPAATSGSSGTPVSVLRGHHSWAHSHANVFRSWRWHGLEAGDRYGYFWGLAHDSKGRRYALAKDRFFNRVRCSAFELQGPRVAEIHSELVRRPLVFAMGYVSALAQFASEVESQGLDGRALRWKAVITTSEVLHTEQRDRLGRIFGCPVVDSYGCAEVGLVGFECAQGGMHVPVESVHVGWLDAGGPEREVLLTDLHNLAQPLVRYRVGDLAAEAAASCPCGRQLPLLGRLRGRIADKIVLPDGRELSPLVPYYVFRHYAHQGTVREYQFAQFPDGRLELRLVPGADFGPALQEEIRSEVSHALGMPVEVRVTDRFERSGRGKHKDFVKVGEQG